MTKKTKKNFRNARGRGIPPRGPRSGPLRGMSSSLSVPPNLRRSLTYTNVLVVNNAGSQGANTTIQLYSTTTNMPGFSSLFANSTGQNAMYLSARLLAVRAKLSCSNQEAFAVRVMAVMGAAAPATNALASLATQEPYASRANGVTAYEVVGPLTGNSRIDLNVSASNAQTLGVVSCKGLADSYTNTWDSATDSGVAAVSGLSLILAVYSAVNLVSGVLISIEAQCEWEFFSVNATKTT